MRKKYGSSLKDVDVVAINFDPSLFKPSYRPIQYDAFKFHDLLEDHKYYEALLPGRKYVPRLVHDSFKYQLGRKESVEVVERFEKAKWAYERLTREKSTLQLSR